MHANVGPADRVIRITLAVVLFAILILAPAPLRWVGLIGIVPLVTAFVGFCPLYALFGLNTCGAQN